MQFKIGNLVRIRPDLVLGKYDVPLCRVVPPMLHHKGLLCTVTEVLEGHYKLESPTTPDVVEWYWPENSVILLTATTKRRIK